MKKLLLLFGLAAGASLFTLLNNAYAQGAAFTYQGRLNNGGSPANGSYDLTFALFTDSNAVNHVGGTLTNTAIAITNGLFTAVLDFGPGIFTGTPLWLQIGVKTHGSGAFTPLTPLQPLTPSPYAIYATGAAAATTATFVSGNGLILTNATAQAAHATNADNATVANGLAPGATLNPADAWALTNLNSASVVTPTNATPNGVTVDFSIRESTTKSSGDLAFTAISNWNPTNYNWSIVHVLANGADCTVTFGAGWRTSGGTCIVTNGTMKDFLFTCQLNVFTNAQWISGY